MTWPLPLLLALLRSDRDSRQSAAIKQTVDSMNTQPSTAINENGENAISDLRRSVEMAGKATPRQRHEFIVHTQTCTVTSSLQ